MESVTGNSESFGPDMCDKELVFGALCNGWFCDSWDFQYGEGIIRIVFVPHLCRSHKHGKGEPLTQVAWNV